MKNKWLNIHRKFLGISGNSKQIFEPISHVEDLVAVRIVAGSIGIGSDPFEQFVISDSGDEIKATSSDGRILMSAETTHVHRSIV